MLYNECYCKDKGSRGVSVYKDGWVWGPARDDAKKQHPCLVPYEELPEEEKDYDRHTALETLRLIRSMGFEIRRAE